LTAVLDGAGCDQELCGGSAGFVLNELDTLSLRCRVKRNTLSKKPITVSESHFGFFLREGVSVELDEMSRDWIRAGDWLLPGSSQIV
jgi:hypothetical protein